MRKGQIKMKKYLKTSLVLLSSIFVLAACGQNNSAQTTQAAQETTQANNKQSKLNPATNNQSQEKTEDNQQNKKKSNQQNNTNSKQQSSSTLPKDGEAVYKLEDNGSTTTLKYYFKDDIVYLQDAVYAFKPKEMGKTEEEIQKLLKKRHSIYDGVKGLKPLLHEKMEFTTTHSKLITTISTGKSFINVLLKHSQILIHLL